LLVDDDDDYNDNIDDDDVKTLKNPMLEELSPGILFSIIQGTLPEGGKPQYS
jgi:hypothetical protein